MFIGVQSSYPALEECRNLAAGGYHMSSGVNHMSVGHLPRSKSTERKLPKTRSQKMQHELCRLILDNIYLEKEVEKIKIELCSKHDFTLQQGFKFFNHKNCNSM